MFSFIINISLLEVNFAHNNSPVVKKRIMIISKNNSNYLTITYRYYSRFYTFDTSMYKPIFKKKDDNNNNNNDEI